MLADTFLLTMLIHFLADFALQTNDQALNKSSSNKWLFYHVATYSVIWMLAMMIFYSWYWAFYFAIITFVLHFVTDYFTSRIVKDFREKEDYHNMFIVIGFDQMLHYLQLHYTMKFIGFI